MLSMLFLTQGKASTHTHVPHKKTANNHTHTHSHRANIRTTHKGLARAARAPTTVPMGRALRARPIGIVVFPFVYVVCGVCGWCVVCGVDVGGLLCGTCVG